MWYFSLFVYKPERFKIYPVNRFLPDTFLVWYNQDKLESDQLLLDLRPRKIFQAFCSISNGNTSKLVILALDCLHYLLHQAKQNPWGEPENNTGHTQLKQFPLPKQRKFKKYINNIIISRNLDYKNPFRISVFIYIQKITKISTCYHFYLQQNSLLSTWTIST